MRKALLKALLEPTQELMDAELKGDYTTRLALLEECKSMPWSAIWDYYCLQQDVPVGTEWLTKVKTYEQEVLLER
jgi:L-rhamnose isomerase